MDDLSRFCCQNRRCVAYGSRGAGNLSVCGHIGKHKHIRHLRCKTCGQRFSERKGTVFYRSHLPPQDVVDLLQHVQDGCGMRQTGRLTGHKEDTVIHYARLAGRHAKTLHEQLAAFSPSDPGGFRSCHFFGMLRIRLIRKDGSVVEGTQKGWPPGKGRMREMRVADTTPCVSL